VSELNRLSNSQLAAGQLHTGQTELNAALAAIDGTRPENEMGLSGPLDEAKLRAPFAQVADPAHHDLVLLSGVGTGRPLVRVHSLLNNLHPVMGHTPRLCFTPVATTACRCGSSGSSGPTTTARSS
jgi:bacteriophage exclusion system BrxB-like protein